MSKPVGFFSLSADNKLIAEMTETWGEDLSGMAENDCLWLIGRIAHELWLGSDSNEPITENAEAVVDRLHELKSWEKVALIRALIQEA
ncbi:hypothetical protein H6G33_17610 [Calothrix sp. FACHB-1219]|uniref:hypothetical protein n=1 Tax=unclassified Calothrix TaxID=2619626 RepID=UPI000B5E841C|nr:MULTISPECIES: hypothetical protein [unclassified Calothrix]MBD2202696.1 hypothetical protein [Calothrix sp. FACHB-168]MBD2218849.1 hypothetical protein [Calothrix sp. FACHB-1219]BAY29734.1 hypothetical protein NIES2107_15780 [Nostoc carneum NIES-2107]